MFSSPRFVFSTALLGVASFSLGGCSGGGSATPAAVSPPAAIAAHYTITPLGILPGFSYSSGGAVNSQGLVTGLCFQSGSDASGTQVQDFHAFLYIGHQMRDLGVPAGYTSSIAGGIDDLTFRLKASDHSRL